MLLPYVPGSGQRSDAPVSIWRFTTASFVCMTSVVGIAIVAKLQWGISAPGTFGFIGACFSVLFAGVLFGLRQRRQLLPIERRRFIVGCFLAIWFYGEFLAIVHRTVTHQGWSPRQVTTAIAATAFDWVLVWVLVRYAVSWILESFTMPEPSPPLNNRSRVP